MRYNLFDGGDYRRRPEDQMQSGYSETYNAEPAIHHKERNVQIENHWDTQGRAWRGNYEGLSEKQDEMAHIVTGDELVSHLIGAGWQLKAVAYHVKRAGSGTLAPTVELLAFDPTTGAKLDNVKYPVVDPTGAPLVVDMAKPGFYVGLVPVPASTALTDDIVTPPVDVGNTVTPSADAGAAGDGVTTVKVVIPAQTITGVTFAVTNGGSPAGTATGDVTVPAQTVDVNVPRGAAAEGVGNAVPVPLLTQTNGYLVNTVALVQNDDKKDIPLDMCVGIYLDLVNFLDENPCDCAPTPCPTEYPDPLCMPL